MRIALDTNRYTDLCRGVVEVVGALESATEVWVPFIVLGKLRAGFAASRDRAGNEAVLRRFLLKPGVRVVFADDETTLHYAAIYRQLRAQGTPIPTNDMWIAALALQHRLVLLHRDRHFDHLPQLATL
jgi:predicted nucleic acid-binding protein